MSLMRARALLGLVLAAEQRDGTVLNDKRTLEQLLGAGCMGAGLCRSPSERGCEGRRTREEVDRKTPLGPVMT